MHHQSFEAPALQHVFLLSLKQRAGCSLALAGAYVQVLLCVQVVMFSCFFMDALKCMHASLLVCMQAVKQNHTGLTESLMMRVNISQAIVQVLLQGPLHQRNRPSLHRQALMVLNQLHMLQNYLDD